MSIAACSSVRASAGFASSAVADAPIVSTQANENTLQNRIASLANSTREAALSTS
jgi:hypothetical protein